MPRIIKRYENRKLYDTEDRNYVSLMDIANLVREGSDVKIVDNATDADITAQTLTQVILEEGKKGRNPLSSEVLHEALRWSNNLIDDGIKQVKQGLDQFIPDTFNKLFNKKNADDMSELKQRIESLENLISSLGDKINTTPSGESNKEQS